jgi:lipopolysaccharide transport system permease protein
MPTILDTFHYAWRSRRAWWFTATARTRARFARTTLGSFWLGLSNLLSIAVLAVVYGTVFRVEDFQSYVVFLGTGLVIWNALAGSIGSAPSLFEYNSGHLQNINLNPVFYTLEEWAFQLQTFFQSFLLVLIGLSFFRPALFSNLILHSWFPLLNLLLFIYWLPLVICLVGARYRDLYQFVPIVLQLVFLLSPILYERKHLGSMGWLADVNPLYRVLSPLRHSLVQGETKWDQGLVILAVNILGIVFGVWLLNRERRNLPFLV